MNESTNYNTFFDIGLSEDETKEFGQLRCTILGSKKKKRVANNELIKKYFTSDKLTDEENLKVKKILDGSIYKERRLLYDHCKLCSDDFSRKDLVRYSSKYKYWNICIPTFPYFPCGVMIYLKDRKNLRIENIQDLPNEMFEELLKLEKDLYLNLRNNIIGNQVVGINALFNQISKSELCIHGHVEIMMQDIDKMDLGCKYVNERAYDKFTCFVNKSVDNSKVLLLPEGIRIPLDNMSIDSLKEILRDYENVVRYYFERGKKIRQGEIEVQDDIDSVLNSNMVPAASNFVYLTFYNDKYMLSSVPELTGEFVKVDDITDDPIDIYSLFVNGNYSGRNDIFIRNFSPLVRPSIKVCSEKENPKVLKLVNDMYKGLEK